MKKILKRGSKVIVTCKTCGCLFSYEKEDVLEKALNNYELPPTMTSEMVSTILCGMVRHVHSAATPSGKPLRHT